MEFRQFLEERLGIKVVKENENNYIACCPLHKNGQEKHPSFAVTKSPPYLYNCFFCGGGPLEKLVRKLHFSIDETHRLLVECCRDARFPAGTRHTIPRYGTRVLPGELILNENLLALCTTSYPVAWRMKWGKQFLIQHDILYDPSQNRIVFCVRDSGGKLRGLLSRAVSDGFRWIIGTGFKRGRWLLGLHQLDNPSILVVVEGPRDWLAVRKAGYPAVSLMGSKFSEHHKKLVLESGAKVVYSMLDNDEAGYEGYKKLVSSLRRKLAVIPVSYSGKDPCESGVGEIRRAIMAVSKVSIPRRN